MDLRAKSGPLAFVPTPKNRGSTAEVCPDGRAVTVLDARVPGGCAWGEQLLVVLGVDFKRRRECKAPPPSDGFAGVRAIVQWGIGEINLGSCGLTAEIDWKHGTVLRVPAEGICVLARYDTCGDCDHADAKIDLPVACVSAGLAYGCGPHTVNTLTEFARLKTSTDVALIPVPPFAVGVTVLGSTDLPLQVEIVNLCGLRTPHDGALKHTRPLPNGSAFIELRAPSLVLPASALVVFELSL